MPTRDDEKMRKFYLQYGAKYPTKEVGRLGKKINDVIAGESGFLAMEALWTVASLIAESIPEHDMERDDYIDALAELAKRRSREFTLTKKA
jgi:hypothetical protein